jgi:hypothetical protein
VDIGGRIDTDIADRISPVQIRARIGDVVHIIESICVGRTDGAGAASNKRGEDNGSPRPLHR